MKATIAMGSDSRNEMKQINRLFAVKNIDRARAKYSKWVNSTKEARIYRAILFVLAEGKCPECGVEMFLSFNSKVNEASNSVTLDHITPLSETLTLNKLDLRIMCKKCNSSR